MTTVNEQTSHKVPPEESDKVKIEPTKEWGYDLYPERKSRYDPSWVDIMFGLRKSGPLEKSRCERTVYECIKTSKMVMLMMSALKSSGCPVDIRRHISCEICDPSVSGGYDPVLNQIVICENYSTKKRYVQSILTHEMLHMFDYCRHKLDFTNIEHVACTEIRAANLTHCSYLSAVFQGSVSPFNFKKRHQDCVKDKAINSIMAVRDLKREEAMEVVNRVFPKCYNDLEPIGRRLKRLIDDQDKAYEEGFYYGYV